eukprot:Skav206788  [mRNA]  locus=scaffold1990:45195:46172:- [translate_table: standard]
MQCSFAASQVDSEDQETKTSTGSYNLPVFTDKIWAVALKAHGKTMTDPSDVTRPCPEILPWVVAFCAAEFTCMDTDSWDAGTAEERAAKAVVPLRQIAESQSPSEEEEEEVEKHWDSFVRSKFDGLDDEEDAFQWSLLWHMANATSNAGLMSSWPEIMDALVHKKKIDWLNTRLYWEKVLFTALLRLQIREVHTPAILQDELPLSEVLLDLQSMYETKFCSPGALGGLKDEHLSRLGVQEEKDVVALTFHSADKAEVVKGMWRHWQVLHVEPQPSSRKNVKKIISQILEDNACSCMCYKADKGGPGPCLPCSFHVPMDIRNGIGK